MPVPVPKRTRPQAHPVNKTHSGFVDKIYVDPLLSCNNKLSFTTRALHPQPTASPARFGSLNNPSQSLPHWTRLNVRQGYHGAEYDSRVDSPGLTASVRGSDDGLIAAEYASVSKKEYAEACDSPVYGSDIPGSDTMAWNRPAGVCSSHSSTSDYDGDDETTYHPDDSVPSAQSTAQLPFDKSTADAGWKERPYKDRLCWGDGTAESVMHIDRMEVDPAPVVHFSREGSTPFAEYVDRVIASDATIAGDHFILDPVKGHSAKIETPRRQQPPSAEPVTDPAYIRAYRQMAEPLSEWMAEYTWRICTTGLSLPPRFVTRSYARHRSEKPPADLSSSVRTLLCSTLLQPSGILLALWYIARLPVYFDWHAPVADIHSREVKFRFELLGDEQYMQALPRREREAIEAQAPFRLVLLGCMLANKWLDDHTFSNKTWQSISEVPIHNINRLELRALSLFAHDLSVTPNAWDQWLSHLHSYHSTISTYPSPIRRPSATDPNSTVRNVIEDLIQLQAAPTSTHSKDETIPPRPIFSNVMQQAVIKSNTQAREVDPLEIDLDEDGPLREEYVPRRRSTLAKEIREIHSHHRGHYGSNSSVGKELSPKLPPPAVWSPEEDPLLDRNDKPEKRVPIHSTLLNVSVTANLALPYESRETRQTWWTSSCMPCNASAHNAQDTGFCYSQASTSWGYPFLSMRPPISHTRSTSSYTNTFSSNATHYRSHSQSHHDNDNCPTPPYSRVNAGYSIAYPFGQDDLVSCRPVWLRT